MLKCFSSSCSSPYFYKWSSSLPLEKSHLGKKPSPWIWHMDYEHLWACASNMWDVSICCFNVVFRIPGFLLPWCSSHFSGPPMANDQTSCRPRLIWSCTSATFQPPLRTCDAVNHRLSKFSRDELLWLSRQTIQAGIFCNCTFTYEKHFKNIAFFPAGALAVSFTSTKSPPLGDVNTICWKWRRIMTGISAHTTCTSTWRPLIPDSSLTISMLHIRSDCCCVFLKDLWWPLVVS